MLDRSKDASAVAEMEALLLQPALEPIAKIFGEYGTLAVQAFTDALAAMVAHR